jgi:integrase
MLFRITMKKGARVNNPASDSELLKVVPKELRQPEPAQFAQFVQHMENAGGRLSRDCADMVQFLAFSGCRKSEAAHLTWKEIDLDVGTIRVTKTKNGKSRSTPVIADMRGLLLRLKSETPEAGPEDPVLLVNSCEEAMTRAAKKAGMARITHHDLRHLFATRCIESGVDIPTVSRWIGHSDGGALALKTTATCETTTPRTWPAR